MGNNQFIELNGNKYDARTGKILTSTPAGKPPASISTPKGIESMDGFSRRPAHPPRRVADTQTPRHQPEKSQTLVRRAVPKPQPVAKQAVDTKLPAVQNHPVPSPKARLARAESVKQSSLVKHFNDQLIAGRGPKQHSNQSILDSPAPQAAGSIALPQTNPLSDALARASSHKMPKIKPAHLHRRVAKRLHISPKILNASAIVLAVLLLGGFLTYQRLPDLSMKLADSRSGVHGTLPNYQPAGFSMKKLIEYKPGQVIVGYHSNSDDRNFSLTQTGSTWDTQSLLDNYVSTTGAHQTVQDKGKTVFLYGNSNATWVDGGIWYKIEGNSNLSSDQLLQIANSL